jgi:hypothetical protein
MRGLVAWVDRQGGMLVAPRATVAALGEDDGARDGTWALVVWLLAVHSFDLVAIAARTGALRTFDAVVGGVAELALGLLPPFAATFLLEWTLGRGRAHRAGTCLAPMLAVGAAWRLLEVARVVPSTGAVAMWLGPAVAVGAAVVVAVLVRDAVPKAKEAEPR